MKNKKENGKFKLSELFPTIKNKISKKEIKIDGIEITGTKEYKVKIYIKTPDKEIQGLGKNLYFKEAIYISYINACNQFAERN
ncbi:MAG: hypothetical protein P8X70_02945 [Nanoarchaeota archaeon]